MGEIPSPADHVAVGVHHRHVPHGIGCKAGAESARFDDQNLDTECRELCCERMEGNTALATLMAPKTGNGYLSTDARFWPRAVRVE